MDIKPAEKFCDPQREQIQKLRPGSGSFRSRSGSVGWRRYRPRYGPRQSCRPVSSSSSRRQIKGNALNLEPTNVGVVLFAMTAASRKATSPSVPAPSLTPRWARSCSAAGRRARNPIDGKGPLKAKDAVASTSKPGILPAKSVTSRCRRPQGHRRADPDRRGQRELIIGDRRPARPTLFSTPPEPEAGHASGASEPTSSMHSTSPSQKRSTVARVFQGAGRCRALEYSMSSRRTASLRRRAVPAPMTGAAIEDISASTACMRDRLRRPDQTGRA